MKNLLLLLCCLGLVALNSGCGTIYGAAVDERNVRTIASDTKIKTTIVKRFIEDETVKTLDITASCYQGKVYLVGEYETTAQKNRAIAIAKSVEGVTGLKTYLLAKKKNGPCGLKENLEITARVKAKLIGDKEIWSTNIDVKTMQCTVVLWGLVGSQAEVGKAINHAKGVAGVKQVKSLLRTAGTN